MNPNSFFKRNSKLIRFVGFVVLALAINSTVEVVFSLIYRNYGMFNNPSYFGYTLVILLIIFSVVRKLGQWFDRVYPWEVNPSRRFFLQAMANILISIFFFITLKILGVLLLSQTFMSQDFGFISFSDLKVNLLIVGFFMLLFVMVDLSYFTLNRWQQTMVSVASFKKENAEFQFNMLRAQINPHFLFNSLNTLSSLIYSNQDLASDFTRKLADVYRNILAKREQPAIKIQEEIESLNSYISLLKIRFADALNVNINIDKTSAEGFIPPLSLQMVVENAIKHNVVSAKKPLEINIQSDQKYITISNNKQLKQSPDYSSEFGLKSIKSRYEYLTNLPILIDNNEKSFIIKLPIIYEV